MMCMEPIIQSEVSQKEKHKYCVLMHIYGIQKDGNNDPISKTAKETDIKNRLLDSGRRQEWDDLREQH